MGWCSGDPLCAGVWETVRGWVPKDKRPQVYAKLIELFEAEDMDCWDCIEQTREGRLAVRIAHGTP